MEDISLLYIDKSRTAHRLMERAVEFIADVTCVESVAEAKKALGLAGEVGESINFIITDFELPDGDGIALAKLIRSDERYADTPILLYSASVNNELAYRAMQVGINESLTKPMDPMALCQRVAHVSTTPQIQPVKRQMVNLTCYYWQQDGMWFGFSPDIMESVQGDSKDEICERMQTLLDDQLRNAASTADHPVQLQTVKHVVSLNIETPDNLAA